MRFHPHPPAERTSQLCEVGRRRSERAGADDVDLCRREGGDVLGAGGGEGEAGAWEGVQLREGKAGRRVSVSVDAILCDGGDRGGWGWYEGSRILLLCLMLGFAFDVRALVRWCWFSYHFVAGERGWI